MTGQDILESAKERIVQHRMGEATVRITDEGGNPLAGVSVTARQIGHEFKFGCNIFLWNDEETDWQLEYRRRFAELLNYATFPFYWHSFESKRGKPRYEYMDKVTNWCIQHRIERKGHPLVWNYAAPGWLPTDPQEIRELSDIRVREIVSRYRGKLDTWDVVNEATDPWRFDNPITEAWRTFGQMPFTIEPFKIARRANPEATLLINDYRNDSEYEKVIEQLIDETGKPLYDVIGLQSHMHGGAWPTEKIWDVCEQFSRFDVPLHFTETTILSGLRTDDGWGKTDPHVEAEQVVQVERFYTVLFSHPSVEAITWWDFSDRNTWMAAPAGLLREDMSPKPVYERLMCLIKGAWWTDEVTGETDSNGEFTLQGFYGTYKLGARNSQDRMTSIEVNLGRRAENRWNLQLG